MDLFVLIECYVICVVILTGIVAASFLFLIGYGIYRFILWLHKKRGLKSVYQVNLDVIHDLRADLDNANAEIERWQKENNQFADIGKTYSEIRAEAIKEFAERFKSYLHQDDFNTPDERWKPESEFANLIDNLVIEMVGV